MPADLPPAEVPASDTTAGAEVSAAVPVAYGAELDADVCLDLDLGHETALALHSDTELTH